MNPEVTVIIPVYNSEKYLSACIESLLNQTYSSFELLLIDDGSTDSSSEICDEYSYKDYRVKVIHQINQGVSCARNTGLSHAKGKYIAFVDGDDILIDKMLEKCIHYMNIDRYDFIWFNIETKAESGKSHWNMHVDEGNIYFSSNTHRLDTILNQYLEYHMIYSVWNKMYQKDFLDKNKIRFDQDIKIGEDLSFNLKCFMAATAACGIPDILYQYWYRENSVINSKGANAIYIKDYALIAQHIEEYAKKKKINSKNFIKIYIKLMDRTYRNRVDRKEFREGIMEVKNRFYLFKSTFRALCHPFLFIKLFGKREGAKKWKDQIYILKYLIIG